MAKEKEVLSADTSESISEEQVESKTPTVKECHIRELTKTKFSQAKYKEHACEVLLHMVVLRGDTNLLDRIFTYLQMVVLFDKTTLEVEEGEDK